MGLEEKGEWGKRAPKIPPTTQPPPPLPPPPHVAARFFFFVVVKNDITAPKKSLFALDTRCEMPKGQKFIARKFIKIEIMIKDKRGNYIHKQTGKTQL